MSLRKKYLEDYKKLDKLCREILNSEQGVSEYIRQMEETPSYERNGISEWESDYKRLKHLRWIRNMIVHENHISECSLKDLEDLFDFRSRIVNQQDPFSLLYIRKRRIQNNQYRKTSRSSGEFDYYAMEYENDEKESLYSDWSSAKLVIGIISIVFCVIMMFQSCAAGINNAVNKTGDVSGTIGAICAVLMLISGIIMISNRKKTSVGALIANIIIYLIACIFALMGAKTFPALAEWGGLVIAFAVFYIGSYLSEKGKVNTKLMIAVIIIWGIIFFFCGLLLSAKFGLQMNNNDNTSQVFTQKTQETCPLKNEKSNLPS